VSAALPAGPPLLRVQGLTVRLGSRTALRDVSFAVRPGTLHALVGPNGAGKSTLLRCALGLLPFEGSITFAFRAGGGIGHVPQGLALDPTVPLTAGDLFAVLLGKGPAFGPRSRALRAATIRALGETGSAGLVDRPLAALSGGELRRVLLAQALVPRPEALLLDEPAASVDEEGARLIDDLLAAERRDHGTTVLLVGHDLSRLARWADWVTELSGRVTFDGPAAGFEAARADGARWAV